jgi:ribosomal protein L11 methyltransferase
MPVALVLEIGAEHSEAVSDRLVELGASSVSVEDAAAGTPEEQPIFDEPGVASGQWSRLVLKVVAETEALGRELLSQAYAGLGLPFPDTVRVEPIADLDWVRATQAQFPAMQVSPRLWIVPSWQEAPDPDAINVVLDPGRAFGTGSHPTTRLCLEWLDREIRGGETVLDYGCGSGILAIVAARLGAGRVVGVDIDAQALETAAANCAANGVSAEFFSADDPLAVRADIVVANILAMPLLMLAPALAGFTREGGRLALAGILSSQFDEVSAAYAPWFDIDARADSEGWVRITGTRRSGA